MSVAVGGTTDKSFRVQIRDGRIDLFVAPPPPRGEFGGFPLFPDLPALVGDISKMFSAGSNIVGDATRLAMVANTSHVTITMQEANDLVLQKSGVSLPFDNASDLVFQVNRRAPLRCMPGGEINRIMKWLVENFQQIQLGAGAAPVVNTLDVATLSIDINTVPGRTFSPNEHVAVLTEIGEEIQKLSLANNVSAL